ncbi:phage tail protein [Citrobacter freundii]
MCNRFSKNLGLGEGSALPVGVPVPWPSATPPTGWMKCNGSTFNLTSFPELAAVFPSGKLPDLRGEFIRGWDDGRGIDAGREILSAQGDAIRNITGTFGDGETAVNASISFYSADGVFATQKKIRNTIGNTTIIADTPNNPYLINFDASRVVPTASENRPRNIAFNYIVRAA